MQDREFNRMQDRAINLARDMQKRAMPLPEHRESESEHRNHQHTNAFFGNNNFTGQNNQTPFCNDACPIKNALGMNGSRADNESMLILGLMLLLISDGGDRLLLLALIYIMS